MRQIDADALTEKYGDWYVEEGSEEGFIGTIKQLIDAQPTIQPDIIYCKDCKHWKDSDGIYRRGFDAESKCPLNLEKVYGGTFYCGMAERREDVKV